MKIFSSLLTGTLCLASAVLSAADIAVSNGDKIAFLGDSITYQGNTNNYGYLHLVIIGLKTAGVEAVAVPAGIGGNKSDNMLERVDRDVIAKKPQWMLLSCGVNDVWHGKRGVELEPYKKNITAICDKAEKAGIRIMILTATMITENPESAYNKKLAAYNDFLRSLAAERKYLLADLNADMQALAAAKTKKGNALTIDGVHMNISGNKMMARGILKAFGVPAEKFAEIEKVWDNTPRLTDTVVETRIKVEGRYQTMKSKTITLSIAEYQQVKAKAEKAGKSPAQYIYDNQDSLPQAK